MEVGIKVNHPVPKLCFTTSIRLLPRLRHAHPSDEAIFTNLHCIYSLQNMHSLFTGLYNWRWSIYLVLKNHFHPCIQVTASNNPSSSIKWHKGQIKQLMWDICICSNTGEVSVLLGC
jgi:hypothetical protein